jgi:hypothetical protein
MGYLQKHFFIRFILIAVAIMISFDLYSALVDGYVVKNGTQYTDESSVYDLKVLKLVIMVGVCVVGAFYPFSSSDNSDDEKPNND